MLKRYLIIVLLSIIFLGLANSAQMAERDYPTIIQDYPKLPACEGDAKCRPGEAGFGLPQFIKYIFLFSLGLVGIIGLLALIIAAFGYVMSAGNPQKASEAKGKITSALLGLLLLLGSVVLLNLINPDLLTLRMEKEVVKVPIGGGGKKEEEGCRYTQATWEPSTIDAGESATLTLHRKDCTLEEVNNHQIITPIKQLVPGVSSDLDCEEIRIAGRYPIETTEDRVTYRFTFNKKCNERTVGWNCKWGGIAYGGDIICNMQKDKPEQFYITGTIEIPNKPKQYIPRINITVIDGR